jgi:hypothetical protein
MRRLHAILAILIPFLLVSCGEPSVVPVTEDTAAPTVTLDDSSQPPNAWQSPPEDLLQVMHAPQLPSVWTAPSGEHLFLADPILYPSLAELAAPMHKLAGMRVNPATNGPHGRRGATSPRLVRVEDGTVTPLELPAVVEIHGVSWSADGQRFAITVGDADGFGLWVGSVEGVVTEMEDLTLNPLIGSPVQWLPDQERLLVRRIPDRGAAPAPPAIPAARRRALRLPRPLRAGSRRPLHRGV